MKHNPTESAEVTAKIDELWAELTRLTSTLDGIGWLDTDDSLPTGYYLWSKRGPDKQGVSIFNMINVGDGAGIIGALNEYIGFTQAAISEAGDICHQMMVNEIMLAVNKDDAVARQRVETIYMPALGIQDYGVALSTVAGRLIDGLMGKMGGRGRSGKSMMSDIGSLFS